MANEHFDVLIIGAGLSGIGAGYHLQKNCPDRTYAILEARDTIGGTWDLFRYPGIRSDSDMYTLGYSFKPWTQAKAIADGPSILKYVKDTAKEHGIDQKIRFGHAVKSANWSSNDANWTVEIERTDTGDTKQLSCNFLFMCSGYYDYDHGYAPKFPGADTFKGQIIHPQNWEESTDYENKRVVIIGSGATAVTLVPEMAKTAAKVTMLQRSPTYMVSMPSEDAKANWLNRHLPHKLAYSLTRWRKVLFQIYLYSFCQRKPAKAKKKILDQIREYMGPDYDVETHFTPRYNPWDQRMCLVPDGDLFDTVKSGKADIVTDHIDTFTPDGVKLKSGDTLPADIIITATGLNLVVLGKLSLSVDGEPVNMGQKMTYKGMMYSGMPNLVSVFGYTNASWTLKCDLTCEYVCRLLNHMKQSGVDQCMPVLDDETIEEEPWLNFSSGYIQRTVQDFPKQGTKLPWRLHQNYVRDIITLRFGKITDGTLHFSKSPEHTNNKARHAAE